MIGRGQAKHFELVMLLSFDDACVGTGKCILNSSGLQDCSSLFFQCVQNPAVSSSEHLTNRLFQTLLMAIGALMFSKGHHIYCNPDFLC